MVRSLSLSLLALALSFGCGDDGTPSLSDSAVMGDTGIGGDTGTPPGDTGTPPGDTGTPPGDTGTPPGDTGTPPGDGSTPGDGGTGAGNVGDACTGDGDCMSGMTCLMMLGSGGFGIDFPDGYCSQEGCAAEGAPPCPSGSTCYSIGFGTFGTSYCAKSCMSMSDCRMGYECTMPSFGMVDGMICAPPFGGMGSGDGGFPFP